MVKEMLDEMERYTGKRPIIYTDITFHKDVLEGELPDYPHWLRSTAAEPEQRYVNRKLDAVAVHLHRAGARRAGRRRPQRLLRHGRRVAGVPEERLRPAVLPGLNSTGRGGSRRPDNEVTLYAGTVPVT